MGSAQDTTGRTANESTLPLPVPLGQLIGRSNDIRLLRKRVSRDGIRLITLVGPPGVGKTRLAIEVLHHLANQFAGGGQIVDLSPLIDATDVLPQIARGMGADEQISALDWISRALRQHPALLLLDNVEHLLPDVAPDIARLLEACPLLTILATSREALHIRGEHVYQVWPLQIPDPAQSYNLRQVSRAPAVTLFVQRARDVVPKFTPTPSNTPALVQICAQLDGLPLAIELAAAHVALFQPEELCDYLKRPLELLADGPLDLPPRHRTLRAAISWSYDLLQPDEQCLLRRLVVFSGGCTLEAVEAVCATGDDTIGLLSSLVRKNLVQVDRSEAGDLSHPDNARTRFSLLETIREYANEQLAADPDDRAATRARHLRYYLEMAERVAADIMTPGREAAFDLLKMDYDNLRVALRWAINEEPDAECAARLTRALSWFWYSQGYLQEGWQWSERALARDAELQPASRVSVRFGLTATALRRGEYAHALTFADEGLAILRRADEPEDLCHLLGLAGQAARGLGDLDRAEELFGESLAIARELQHTWHLAGVLWGLSEVALEREDFAKAEELGSQALDLWWQLDDKQGAVLAMDVLAAIALRAGELNRSRQLHERNLSLRRGLGDRQGTGVSLRGLADVARKQRQLRRSMSLYLRSIDIALDVGDLPGIAACLEGMATVELQHERLEWATTLLGATEQARTQGGMPPLDASPESHEVLAELRSRLSPSQFADAWRAGRERPFEKTASKLKTHALEGSTIAPSPSAQPMVRQPVPLSRRERQVAGLIAAGHDNTRIAAELVLSKRTVETHVSNILRKLNLDSRIQIALWAADQGLSADGFS